MCLGGIVLVAIMLFSYIDVYSYQIQAMIGYRDPLPVLERLVS